VGYIIIALTVGFLLGMLLMILLVSGREEEGLLERVEEAELSRRGSAPGVVPLSGPVGGKPGQESPSG
jgi:hypothetical protein